MKTGDPVLEPVSPCSGVHDVFANEGATGTWFAVTRQPGTEWQSLAPMVRDFLQELPENDSKLAEGLEVEGTTEGLEGAEEIIRIFMLSVGNPSFSLDRFVEVHSMDML